MTTVMKLQGGLSRAGCEMFLREVLVRKTYFVGLCLGQADQEVNDRSYSRKSVTFGELEEDETTSLRFVSNTNEVRYGPWSNDSPAIIAWWILTETARGDNVLMAQQLLRARAVMSGEEIVFRPGELRIGFTYVIG